WFGVDLDAMYLPHGVMIGAGLVALIQIIKMLIKKDQQTDDNEIAPKGFTRSLAQMRRGMGRGYLVYLAIAIFIAIVSGIITEMSVPMLIGWCIFAAFAAIASELIVGISAMHSGWFPAFATALIFLVIGMLFGFPPIALAMLVGFAASTGPAFADMAYDLKAGWILRGEGEDPEFEKKGRKQQYIAELISFMVAIGVVFFAHEFYFEQDLFPPVVRVYVTTIGAGSSFEVARNLLIWAIPGAIIQFAGGPSKQLGVLFATGLLINYPIAGVTVLVGLTIRLVVLKKWKEEGQSALYVLGAGFIAGAAVYSFFTSTLKLGKN
ncbi:MAG: OPT/YSL family transporter, partial [Bacillota bacterium]|nr:OPT/YSL family transporter [Bacillota bacterium]